MSRLKGAGTNRWQTIICVVVSLLLAFFALKMNSETGQERCRRHAGWVMKMGYSNTSFRRRFAILENNCISYHKGMPKAFQKPRGEAVLLPVTRLQQVQGGFHPCEWDSFRSSQVDATDMQPKILPPGMPYLLEIKHAKKREWGKALLDRTFYFSFETLADLNEWETAINHNIRVFYSKDVAVPNGAAPTQNSPPPGATATSTAPHVPQSTDSGQDVHPDWVRVHVVASRGSVQDMIGFMESGIDVVNVKNSSNGTPIIQAAGYGNIAILQYLISQGADLEQATDKGNTALHSAARNGQTDAVRMLLEKGANAKVRNASGLTPRDLAPLQETRNVFDSRHSLNDGSNSSPLVEPSPEDIENDRRLEAALREKISPHLNTPEWQEVDPSVVMVHLVASSGRLEEMVALLRTGHDIHASQPQSGSTPLIISSGVGNIPVVKFLIENGASLSASSVKGNTALHMAARRGQATAVKILLKVGADSQALNGAQETPLMVAATDETIALLSPQVVEVPQQEEHEQVQEEEGYEEPQASVSEDVVAPEPTPPDSAAVGEEAD